MHKYVGWTCKPERHGILTIAAEITLEISAKDTLHTDSKSSQSLAAHNAAFKYTSKYIEDHILTGDHIERLSMIRERYLTYMLENYPKFYNDHHKTYKLRLAFWQPRKKAKLVYAADIGGEAVQAAFELLASGEKRHIESAAIIIRHINEGEIEGEPMSWPPSAAWLLSGEGRPPQILLTFLIYVITGKPVKHASL